MTAPIRVREFEELLFGRSRRPRVLVMITVRGAFDASMDSGSGITAIAGYVGLVSDWEAVEEQWNAQLRERGIENFHSSAVFREFEAGAVDVIRDFARIAGESRLRFVSAHMLDTDWSAQERPDEYARLYKERQHACLDLLLEVIAEDLNLEFKGIPASIVFCSDYGKSAWAMRVYDAWLTRTKYSGFGMISFTPGEKEWDIVPLQCADMLAGLVRHNSHALKDLESMDGRAFGQKLAPIAEVAHTAMTKGRGTRWSFALAKELAEIIKKRRETS